MESKSQILEDVSIEIHSIKNDGTDNTGDVANLSTIIKDPAGNELVGGVDYTEATFDEIGNTGEYACLFPSTAPDKVFTSVDQNNPYRVILVTSTADIGSSGKDIKIVSQLIGEVSNEANRDAAETAMQADLTDIKDVGLGKWVVDPVAGTLTLYRIDGITVLKVFDLTESSDIIPAYVARVPAP